ncbi:M23 family metallopeptidase [Paenibacillus sabinae]|uniref:Metalloendopeptidase-related membrane protein n=1 Tax=Paenibacillus sabinae T27 TaxID=1268072 RepID=X4ZHA1_9BACL|nr:M23 family metallopeptidase [Paenibacillus sabinae]AHV98871.1 metalloendopeptidase-related membrane protein [Paenibacillus sabinae T27]
MPFLRTRTQRALISLSAAAALWGSSGGATAGTALNPQAGDKGLSHQGNRIAVRSEAAAGDTFAARQHLFDQLSATTNIPWYRLAAIDQYERTLAKKGKSMTDGPQRLIGISVPEPIWCGPLNPDQEDTSPSSISFFDGFGRDGSGDGKADLRNDIDVLYSMAAYLAKYGNSASDFNIAVWEYYHNGRASQRIDQFSKLYRHFGRLDLSGSAFPLPLGSTYSYRSTWGSGRSWGGARIHEGTDLFTPHGVTVRSTCYGVVETKGWNRYGGWRIGIRDIENRYHYYAHLSGFDKSLSAGDIVIPGQQLGWAGSSGYGKPGTQGKFPPHLHYGIYKDRGLTEWAFDPYPLLKQWENTERIALKKNKKSR